MGKYRAVVIGAGRIGAGYQWPDKDYTHAGAYQALKDRVELVGFIEPDNDRAVSAKLKWEVPVYEDVPTGLMALRPHVVSICVQPEQQAQVIKLMEDVQGIKGIWCEKPFYAWRPEGIPVQVNYLRRGNGLHRLIAEAGAAKRLIVYGKKDVHTLCHFDDLAKFWNCQLDYREFNGPCAYVLEEVVSGPPRHTFFDNGGVEGGPCMKAMLGNLLDHIEGKAELWSPAI
jgi:hypothetical protein